MPSGVLACPGCSAPWAPTGAGACSYCGARPSAAEGYAPPVASVVLLATGKDQIHVIKELRELLQLSLRDAKDLSDRGKVGPTVVLADAPPEVAERFCAALQKVGAAAEVRRR